MLTLLSLIARFYFVYEKKWKESLSRTSSHYFQFIKELFMLQWATALPVYFRFSVEH